MPAHGILRQSFYALRKRATADGPAAVFETGSRRLRSSPSKLTDEAGAQAVQARAASELDPVPSVASPARIFRGAVATHKVPQRLFGNGLALNPWRRGLLGQLVVHVSTPNDLPAGTTVTPLTSVGTFTLHADRVPLPGPRMPRLERVLVTLYGDTINVIDLRRQRKTPRPAPQNP